MWNTAYHMHSKYDLHHDIMLPGGGGMGENRKINC